MRSTYSYQLLAVTFMRFVYVCGIAPAHLPHKQHAEQQPVPTLDANKWLFVTLSSPRTRDRLLPVARWGYGEWVMWLLA